MASLIHQLPGSHATSPRSSLWGKGSSFKQQVTTVHMIGRTDVCISVKHNLSLRIESIHRSSLKLSAFKDNGQNNQSRDRSARSKVSSSAPKVAYIPEESGETITDASAVDDVPLRYTSVTSERILGYRAIGKLFQKCLNTLQTQLSGRIVNRIIERPSPSLQLLETEDSNQINEEHGILKTIWCCFLRLDATVKISTLIFIPLYLAVSVIHGTEVTKELTPLWILGPFCVTLYVKLVQLLSRLYVFSFRQIVKVIKNLTWYFQVGYGYVMQGKLKEDLHVRVVSPITKMKYLDYKNEFKEWILDYGESIWPYHRRTIGLLKRAHLI